MQVIVIISAAAARAEIPFMLLGGCGGAVLQDLSDLRRE